jgi:hypothetical protein
MNNLSIVVLVLLLPLLLFSPSLCHACSPSLYVLYETENVSIALIDNGIVTNTASLSNAAYIISDQKSVLTALSCCSLTPRYSTFLQLGVTPSSIASVFVPDPEWGRSPYYSATLTSVMIPLPLAFRCYQNGTATITLSFHIRIQDSDHQGMVLVLVLQKRCMVIPQQAIDDYHQWEVVGNPNSNSTTPQREMNGGLLAGILLGSIGGVTLLFVFLCVILRRQWVTYKDMEADTTNNNNNQQDNPMELLPPSSDAPTTSSREF